MKYVSPIIDKSTFGSAQKDLFKIVNKIIENENLKKLLVYSSGDALSKPNLTDEESLSLIHKNIRIVPKLQLEDEVETYIIISFDNFMPNANNPQFRDNVITFDILSYFDYWPLNHNQLRPHRIMGEIDGMLNGQSLNGIGKIDFLGANQLILSNEIGGFSLSYRVINDVR